MRYLAFVLVGLVTLLAVTPQSTFAQTSAAQVNGTVTDSTGAVVPGATLKLKNQRTGIEATATTNDRGSYVFVSVHPGTYVLQAELSGFKTAIVQEFTLNVNQVLTQNISLAVGQVTESVQVKAEAPLLQASTSELGTVIGQKAVERIPLNGRNFTQLMLMMPGVTSIETQSSAGSTSGTMADSALPGSKFVRPVVNGQWNRSNMFLLDGVLNTTFVYSGYAILPSIDAIQEFKVQSHNDKGEYGGVMGGVVNVATKSGGNDVHGTLSEFLRNELFNARNPFTDITKNPQTGKYRGPAQFRQNQFAGTIGGPVDIPKLYDGRNKTFFFFTYDGWRYRKARASLSRVPTDSEVSGDLSSFTQAIYDPATTRVDPTNSRYMIRDAFPKNQIPSALINPMVKSYIQTYFDRPNTPAVNFNNLVNNRSTQDNSNSYGLRIDHRFGDKATLFARYNLYSNFNLNPKTLSNGVLIARPRKQIALGLDQFLTRSLILTTRVAHTSVPYQGRPENPVSFDDMAQAGWTTATRYGFPDLSFGIGSTGLGGDTFIHELDHNYQWSQDLSWVTSNHQFKFGSLVYYNRRRTVNPNSTVSFSADQTSDPRQSGGVLSGVALASALLGVPSGFSGQREHQALTLTTWGFYAQDEWKVTPSVTMNLSLRHEFFLAPHYLEPFAGDFDYITGDYLLGTKTMPPGCLTAGVAPCLPGPTGTLAGVAGGSHIRLADTPDIRRTHFRNFEPRVGVAWRFAPKTVLRGGWGIIYDVFSGLEQEMTNMQGAWPNSNRFNGTFNLLGDPLTTVQQAINSKNNPLPDATPWLGTSNSFDPRKKPAYSNQYNVEIQHQLKDNLTLSLAYVGSVNRRMPLSIWINTSPMPGPGTAAEVNARRPFPYMAYSPKYGTDLGESSYNSLQFHLNRRFAKGLTAIVSYTWSKSIDNGASGWFGSENGSAASSANQDSYHLNAGRAVSGYDVPHNLWAGGSWEMPFGKGKRWLRGGPLAWVLGNWRGDFIQELRSGQAWNPRINGDIANVGKSSYMRPNLIGDPSVAHPTVQRWINTAAFGIPAFAYGNLGRNTFRSSHVFNMDFSFTKEFHPAETVMVEFRAEAFNIFNIMNYGVPQVTMGNSNFGTVTGLASGEPPRQIQFGLRLSFGGSQTRMGALKHGSKHKKG